MVSLRLPGLLWLALSCSAACSDSSSPTPADAAVSHIFDDAGKLLPTLDASHLRDARVDDGRIESGPGDPTSADAGQLDSAVVARDASQARTYSTNRDEFFGTPRCAADTFVLCEDFEGVASGSVANPQIWQTADDRIFVENARAARGKQALHVVTKASESVHSIRTTKIVPATKNKMWGRLFFWVEPPRPTAFNHWTVIEATGVHPAGGTARMRFGGIDFSNTNNQLDFNYDIWGKQPANFHETGGNSGHDLPDSKWHCLEWMYDVPGRAVRLYRDGSEETALTFSSMVDGIALDFPPIDGLNIGMAIYQDIGASTWDVWIDEVAVDTQRIGCSN